MHELNFLEAQTISGGDRTVFVMTGVALAAGLTGGALSSLIATMIGKNEETFGQMILSYGIICGACCTSFTAGIFYLFWGCSPSALIIDSV